MHKKYIRNSIFIFLLHFSITATAQAAVTHYTYDLLTAAKQKAPQQFMAGAATVDITPQPGVLPRAGYSMRSTIGDGFRTRLYARIYYLRDVHGNSHMLVQMDLATASRILHSALGELLAKTSDIDASRLTLTATHTHSGPGQIVGSNFYNKFISNKPGFAKNYFEFLLKQISTGAQHAIASQAPAKIATGRRAIWGETRNRSQLAYVQNNNIVDKGIEAQKAYHRINPYMYMLRIDTQNADGSYQPLAAFASFAIHGTALPENERLFNADVWAYIHKDWQWFVEQHYQPKQAVHIAAFEGTHGDVAPASHYAMLGFIEARRLGKNIAAEAIELYKSLDTQLSSTVKIQSSMRFVDLKTEPVSQLQGLCRNAALGQPMVAAPEEHTTPVLGHLPFIKQGSRRWGKEINNCQGRKRLTLFELFQPLVFAQHDFPHFIMLQWLQINDLVIIPLPFEITTEAGARIEQTIREAYKQQQKDAPLILISSVANGYTGYATTPEEYDRQYYEGGHTLYGKNTQPFLSAQLKRLVSDSLTHSQRLVELPASLSYNLESKNFLEPSIDVPKSNATKTLRMTIKAPYFTHARGNQEAYWRYEYQDVDIAQIEIHKPLLSVETRLGNEPWQPLVIQGVVVNDQGYDLALRLIARKKNQGSARYAIEWYNPLFTGDQRQYRFALQARGQQPLFYSPEFH